MAKRLPAAAMFVQAGPRSAGLAGQQRGRTAALGPTAARAGPEPAQPVAAGHCTLGTGRRSSAGLRVAAQKMGCTSRISASRATPAYIYMQGLEILEIRDILGNN